MEDTTSQEESQSAKVVYKCNHCDFKTGEKKCLKDHSYKEHKSEQVKLGSFKCKQCNYVGVKQDSFEQHVRMKHANTKDSKMSTRHVCEFCDYESVSELNMRTHERDVHMRTKSKSKFPYEQCNKDFETSHHLHRHKQEVHTEKLFPCDV